MTAPIVQTPPLSDPTLQNVDAMVGEVASLVGGSQDPDARSKAIICLDRAADRLNMAGVWLFRAKSNTWSTSGSGNNLLSSGDQTLTKPSDWGFPVPAAFAYDSSSNQVAQLKWLQWDLFESLKSGTDNAIPGYLSLRSVIDDEIFIWPYVDTGTVASIVLNYYARVQRPSEVTSVSVLDETREALILGGEYYMMRYRYAGQPTKYRPFRDDFYHGISGALAASNRWLDATFKTIVPDLDGNLSRHPWLTGDYTPGTAYIKI